MTVMAKKFPLVRLGVVGGGQLARMLAPACNNYNVQMTILDPSYNSPAGQVAFDQIEGDLDDPAALQLLCERSDIVTFDIENIRADILIALADQGIEIVPKPSVMRLIQNKFDQKCHYRDSGILTADFTDLSKKSSFSDVEAFGLPCVQKTHTGGYDGRGVHIIRSIDDWENRLETPSFIEQFIANGTELAVIVARRASGEMVVYDPVEMVVDSRLNLLDYLIAPARVNANVLKIAQELAKKTVESFATPGLFGVELFLTNSGDLLVNEVAPRAHNSGHHTIEACVTSQFENQLRACLDLPLGQTDLHGCALTANLIGEVGYVGRPVIEGLDQFAKIANSYIHLYGKDECSPGRKMGHFTLVGDDHDELTRRLASIRDVLIIRGDTPQ